MIPANQTQVINAVLEGASATLTDEGVGSTTNLVVKDADSLADTLMAMMHPNAAPIFKDTYSVHPEPTGAKIESPPMTGNTMFVPWRFILPMIEQLRA